ncbi:MAG: sirohydrochlorin chelatase [Deltaproteobacteria bacterium]|jgi:sirohydrochlorin ferrochelatase
MRAYLLVDHGSRLEAANEVVARVARAMEARLGPGARVGFAHQEAAGPSIDEAVDALVREGMRQLVVVPFFLAPGRHATSDVPRLARAAVERHPGVTVEVSAPPLPERADELAALVLGFVGGR